MAPMKRARNLDDEEVVAVESASSSLRLSGAQNKKARLSVNQNSTKNRRRRSPSSSSSEDELPDAEDEDISGPPATQYEIIRDNGFKHLQDTEADDAIATQKFFSRRRGQIGQNVAAENAIIEEVTCINFMCHTKLHVQLSPLINFVVGMNGSGKSAVLTAITLCLGGKASATNRGASLKTLIRGSEESAILKVRLKNEGSDAYQPDLYGDSIIVERHFSRSGSSGFRLKNAAGRTISTKKGDVDDIIEYFNLQVDNPMNVLTQDAAKSFIQTSTPAQKYKFFVEGVQLQQLDNDYRLVSDTCDLIESNLGEAKKDLKVLRKKYDAAEQRAKIVQQHQGMKEAGGRLRNQLVWVQIEEAEARLGRREDTIVAVQEAITEAEHEVQEKDDAYQQVDLALENVKRSVKELEDELIPLNTEEEAAKHAHNLATASVQTAHTDQRQIKTSMKAAEQKVATITHSIADENKRIEDANGGARSRKLADIEDALQAVAAARETLDQSETEGPRLAEQLRTAENNLRNIAAPLTAKREEVKSCDARIHDLKTKQPNIMDGYDANMPGLMRAIRDDRGFREPPIGPMGLHIKLLKPMWSNMIESILGRSLNGFIVTSKADQVRLSSILRRHNMEQWCPILIGNHHPVNTAGYEPDPQYDTILRVLEFDDDIVRRQLVIQSSIEQALLIPRRADAYATMYEGAKPKNAKSCYALHDTSHSYGHRLAYGGRTQSDANMESVQYKKNGRPRMKTDSQSQIRLQEETLQHLRRELKELESRQKQLQLAVSNCKAAVEKHRRSHQILKAALQKSEDRVEQLQSELEKDSVEDGRLDSFKSDLAEAETELKICQESYITALTERDNFNSIAVAKKTELDAVKLRVADQTAKIQKAKAKQRNTESARHSVLIEKNQAINQLTEYQQRLDKAEEARDAQAEQVSSDTSQAMEICLRVPVPEGETHASLEAKFKKIADQLKTYNKRLGATDEEVILAQEEALRKLQTATTSYDEMEELLVMLKASFQKRMTQFWRFQRHISARSRISFSYLLSNRAFRGKLLIDHKAKKLDVHVEPDETTKSGKGRQTKTLSGGEKSFSSICLLLALWEAMGAPLRCLDEYDVFMDDVNRDVSTKMIIDAARHSAGRQYIMITPKALGSGAADADDVKIHKLDDPRDKGQKRIDDMLEAA